MDDDKERATNHKSRVQDRMEGNIVPGLSIGRGSLKTAASHRIRSGGSRPVRQW